MECMKTSIMDMARKAWTRIGHRLEPGRQREWKDREYFDEAWKARIRQMSAYIESDASVLDVGCGQCWLKEYLAPSNAYTGIDYVDRGDNLVFDFNSGDAYPSLRADIGFCSGVLEYVEEPGKFVHWIASVSRKCIVSYCLVEDFPDTRTRRKLAWKNDLDRRKLVNLFAECNFQLSAQTITATRNSIFVFEFSADANPCQNHRSMDQTGT